MKTCHYLLLVTIASALLMLTLKPTVLAGQSPEHSLEQKNSSQPCAKVFSIYDIDGDGTLNQEEYQAFVEQLRQRRKARGHRNRPYPLPLQFEEIDTNSDGYITEDELIPALNRRLRQHKRYRARKRQW